QVITGLQIENHEKIFTEAIAEQVNEEKNWRYEMFELNYLPSNLNVRVQYEVEHEGKSFKGDEVLRLYFDTDNVEKIDSKLYNIKINNINTYKNANRSYQCNGYF